MALPASHRLKRRQDFDQLYRRGKRVTAHHIVLRVLRQDSHSVMPTANTSKSAGATPWIGLETDAPALPTKVGVVVSLKVSKRAVVRNRIRRQLQAALYQVLPQMQRGWLVLISARTTAAECDYWQFLRELEQLLTRAEVIHGHSGRGVL